MHNTFTQLQTELVASVAGLTAAQTQLRPAAHPEKWSIQQIVDHLCRTYAATDNAFRTRLEKGQPTKASPSLQQRLGQFMITTLGRFPEGRDAPAPVAPPNPEAPLSGEQLAGEIATALGRTDALAAQAETLFGSKRSISHMVLGPLSVPQWRKFHLIHARHHLKQILAIRRDHNLARGES